jgi:hypothetical protein
VEEGGRPEEGIGKKAGKGRDAFKAEGTYPSWLDF